MIEMPFQRSPAQQKLIEELSKKCFCLTVSFIIFKNRVGNKKRTNSSYTAWLFDLFTNLFRSISIICLLFASIQ